MSADPNLRWFRETGAEDVALVGGKGASLGEMFNRLTERGVLIPDGFTTTVQAYRTFLDTAAGEERGEDFRELAPAVQEAVGSAETLGQVLDAFFDARSLAGEEDLHARAVAARAAILSTPIPQEVARSVRKGYDALCEMYGREVDTAVRSSATREDSDVASFAGQYESYLNVRGHDEVLEAWRKCIASGFSERALGYQLSHGMNPLEGSVAVVIMKMVRADLATSGVLFTLDPDSGNRNVVVITSSYGLGEMVVQGNVSPDTFVVWKEGLRKDRRALVHRRMGAKDRKLIYTSQGGTATESVDVESALRRRWSLTEDEVLELARMALEVEDHYGRPMDVEWAKDGQTGKLFLVQARPETVHANDDGSAGMETYRFPRGTVDRLKDEGRLLLEGTAVGTRIGSGRVRKYGSYEEVIARKRRLRALQKEGVGMEDLRPEEHIFDAGDVLVTEITTPDWEPLMKEASLIVTERGGRTSHAAIVAREFGIPAIVGCVGAMEKLETLQTVTGRCAEGEMGLVFDGEVPFEVERVSLAEMPETRTRIKLNVGFPDKALLDAMLPVDGVGLARIEFVLTAQVGIHPLALAYYPLLRDFSQRGVLAPALEPYEEQLREEDPDELDHLLGAVERRTPGYTDQRTFFVDQVKFGVGLICAAFHPRPVLVRLSDLKSNEYRDLLGGRLFEPLEENPMIAWRGASRYTHPGFRDAFAMECEALRFVHQEMGFDNLQLMVPFCRTPEEGKAVVEVLAREGLGPAQDIPVFLMVEIPSNVLEAKEFIEAMSLAGGSIGSNDLVQTVYAVSRDDLEHYAHPVDARSPAVKRMIRSAIESFTAAGLEIGICGQAPSDHPDEIPRFLVEAGISSISVTPDTAVQVRLAVAEAEKETAVVDEPTVLSS
ncbi:MAG: phosphoenolpyruvate synthase [Gemmatimonadota bacterium]